MKAFLKSLSLRNYCGFKSLDLDFSDNDEIKNLSLFFAPNGTGKTTVLNAVRMLSFPWQFMGRDNDLALRKMTYHPDYDPSLAGFVENKGMRAEAIFIVDDNEKKVVIENTEGKAGVVLCELEKSDTFPTYSFFIDADNPMQTAKFQLNSKYADKFLELAASIYDFPCELPQSNIYEVDEKDKETGEKMVFYVDFVLKKPNGTRVHFKTMSAGERKIATLLQMLCSPNNLSNYNIFLIDNYSMHVYFRRHGMMIDKLLEHFYDKQILATTHSGTMIDHVAAKYGDQYLYDLEECVKGVD